METTRRLNSRVADLETRVPAPACRTCASRPAISIGGATTPCPECGQEPFVFTIDIDRAAGREGDAA